ncbi:protein phosphatase CheZ [Stutzerimonas kirkiae]|uniref:Protein phosphatase CheZ n=1 Tax=Stutzerimonas kirkiae TaxID=2211392 RepID=A0A4Q9RBH3_9GAMM|nr:protein phosphatase CheZ [Stutzerimonas kirkiae]TBU98281.1 protein phosphatase [Stutzerimonas kirkiae]TBV00955.1 protein phosphatase [Stutzerimonas kirkiae]TBV07780.1 protein phosphatase [Stutzerimonas kirkiae]TBV16263.1 protein phosphatase [Stutzerimonas kirkiae]
MTQAEENISEFQQALKEEAHQLVESLDAGRFDDAVQLIHKLNQTRDRGLYQEVGKLTRELHNAILKLEIDTRGEIEASQITDATNRLSYVVQMTEKAANRTMDLVEECAPLVNYISYESQSLTADWQRFMRREMNAEQFRELARRIDDFLKRGMGDSEQLSRNLREIMLAQDFQDLTGQVIKRVTGLITELESNLLKLVLMAGQVDQFAGIQHDHDAMLAEQQKLKEQKEPSKGEGPQMNADMRKDVVSGQDDVDDLLSSLGF